MNEWHAWLCDKSRRFTVTGFDYFCSSVTYSEMLKTVIKFHRLKYVRGKKRERKRASERASERETWLTMVLQSTGVRGEGDRALWTSTKEAFSRAGCRWERESTLRTHLLRLAEFCTLGANGIRCQRVPVKRPPKQTVGSRGEKLDTNHLTGNKYSSNPGPRHPRKMGFLSETGHPMIPLRCSLRESCQETHEAS